jgi:hypothetical protein
LAENSNVPVTIKNSHAEIIPFIKNNMKNSETHLEFINIDHHHDLGYIEPKNDEPITYGCANWVLYFSNYLHLPVSYTWINNINSELPENTNKNITINSFTPFLETINLAEKFDAIFICASWEWVPIKYQPLFNILTSIIQKKGHVI